MKNHRRTAGIVLSALAAVSLISCGGDSGQDEGPVGVLILELCDALTKAMGTGSEYERVFAAAVLDTFMKEIDSQQSRSKVTQGMKAQCGEAYRFAAAG